MFPKLIVCAFLYSLTVFFFLELMGKHYVPNINDGFNNENIEFSVCYFDEVNAATHSALDIILEYKNRYPHDKIEFKELVNKTDKLLSLNKSECDVYYNVSGTRNGYDKTRPYFYYPALLFSMKGGENLFSISSPEKSDMKVGVISGYDTIGLGYEFGEVVFYDGYKDMAKGLELAQINLALVSKRNYDIYSELGFNFLGYYNYGWPLSFYIKSSNDLLISRFEVIL